MSKSALMDLPVIFERISALARHKKILSIIITAVVFELFILIKDGLYPTADRACTSTTRQRTDDWWKKHDNIVDIQNKTLGVKSFVYLLCVSLSLNIMIV